MDMAADIPDRQVRTGKHPTVESVDLEKYVVGTAIVHHVYRVIRLNEARRLVREAREAKLAGNFFQAIVYRHEFEENSPRRIYLMAEVLGVDPGFEIVQAYQNPDAYFSRCKSFSIQVPDFVRRRLNARRTSIDEMLESMQKERGISDEMARANYEEALRKIREEVVRSQEHRRRRESFDHPSLFNFEVAV